MCLIWSNMVFNGLGTVLLPYWATSYPIASLTLHSFVDSLLGSRVVDLVIDFVVPSAWGATRPRSLCFSIVKCGFCNVARRLHKPPTNISACRTPLWWSPWWCFIGSWREVFNWISLRKLSDLSTLLTGVCRRPICEIAVSMSVFFCLRVLL